MRRWMVVSLIVALSPVSLGHAQERRQVLWTITGGSAGFGIGLWVGLSAFDDAVNSDRKVWTSAVVGAGVGAVTAYLISRARDGRRHPSTAGHSSRNVPLDPRELEQLAKSIRFDFDRLHSASRLIRRDSGSRGRRRVLTAARKAPGTWRVGPPDS